MSADVAGSHDITVDVAFRRALHEDVDRGLLYLLTLNTNLGRFRFRSVRDRFEFRGFVRVEFDLSCGTLYIGLLVWHLAPFRS